MKEYTPNIVIPIDEEAGKFNLTVTEPNKPIWFGDYETGKLSIFFAEPIGDVKVPCYGLVYVISAQPDANANGMGFAMYHEYVSQELAINTLLIQIKNHLATREMEMRDAYGATIQ